MRRLLGISLFFVALTYISVGTGCQPQESSGSSAAKVDTLTAQTAAQAGLRVAYVHSDSLLDNFDAYQEKVQAYEQRLEKEDADLRQRQRTLQQKYQNLQANMGSVSQQQIMDAQAQLEAEGQRIMQRQQQVAQQLGDLQAQINEEMQKRVSDVIKDYARQEGYDLVLSYAQGGQVLFVNPDMDVTKPVLARLNAAADTTAVEE